MNHSNIVDELIVILLASVLVSALFHRIRVPTIISYLAVGILVGPSGIGVVHSVEEFQLIAEFGVAFLLFTLGLEFSLARMLALRRIVFGLGTLQVLICIAVFGGLIYLSRHLYEISLTGVLVVAAAIALSSTAIVSKELSQRNEVSTQHGQMAIGILLFQDIAAIVILVVISAVGGSISGGHVGSDPSTGNIGLALLSSGFNAILFLVATLVIGKWLLPPLFTEISKTRSEELFVLTVLVVALISAAAAHALGLAMALGAFMAGMILGESHFRHQIEAEIKPFRDLLLGIFFVSVGLIVNLDLVVEFWPRILLFGLCLIVFKCILIALLSRFFSDNHALALRTGLILSQGGEFGFALLTLAVKGSLVPQDVASFFISIIILSMIATPFLVMYSETIANWVFKKNYSTKESTPQQALATAYHGYSDHVVLCGYGRVGQTIARFLRLEQIPFVAIDNDMNQVKAAQALDEKVEFGNLTNRKLLAHLQVQQASLVVISFDDYQASQQIIHEIKQMNSELPILVRTRDDSHLSDLLASGASEVIPETLEGSLMLVSHIMATLGMNSERVFTTIDQVRKERYKLMRGLNDSPFDNSRYQPVYLPDGAFAVNKTLGELRLGQLGTQLVSVRRGKKTLIDIPEDDRVLAGDILVLAGESSALEAAESYLLSG